jgi:hypothetical protein
VKTGDRQ